MRIRAATAEDLPAIFAIYDREVLTGAATFDTEPFSEPQRRQWLEKHRDAAHPALVAEEGGKVVGWGTLSAWSDRCAYARAAEVSVYVHPDHQSRGIGRTLLAALVDAGRQAGLGVLLARIETSGTASLRLHEAAGFRRFGTMRRVGEKFGRILDVELLDLHLDGG
jgi:L-amino acid N-acyltransferase YncA